MAIKTSSDKAAIFNEINITPLTDIFLVLLIIMMVIAPLLDQQGLKLAVPKLGVTPQEQKDNKFITVSVDKEGNLQVDNKPVDLTRLVNALTDLKKVKNQGLIIQADGDSTHQSVVSVMDSARSARIENISVVQK